MPKNSKTLIEKLNEAKESILSRCSPFPSLVIVLGSGLGSLADDIERETDIAYSDIPHFRPLSVEGHVGRIRIGQLQGVRVACMQGRLHYYEGYPMEDVVFPVRAFGWAGAKAFLLTNASGGLKPDMKPLDFLVVRDHINMTGTSPLIGMNSDELGPRFPDVSHLYDRKFSDILAAAARRAGVPVHEGVYLGTHGPAYETPAEVRMYRMIGADVVGMSTVPEALALHHMGMRVACLSCVTNLAAGVTGEVLIHADILANAKKIYARFSKLMKEAIREIAHEID